MRRFSPAPRRAFFAFFPLSGLSERLTAVAPYGLIKDAEALIQIIDDFPELERDDILACLQFAADRERHR